MLSLIPYCKRWLLGVSQLKDDLLLTPIPSSIVTIVTSWSEPGPSSHLRHRASNRVCSRNSQIYTWYTHKTNTITEEFRVGRCWHTLRNSSCLGPQWWRLWSVCSGLRCLRWGETLALRSPLSWPRAHANALVVGSQRYNRCGPVLCAMCVSDVWCVLSSLFLGPLGPREVSLTQWHPFS